jgi:hypothetical protein
MRILDLLYPLECYIDDLEALDRRYVTCSSCGWSYNLGGALARRWNEHLPTETLNENIYTPQHDSDKPTEVTNKGQWMTIIRRRSSLCMIKFGSSPAGRRNDSQKR